MFIYYLGSVLGSHSYYLSGLLKYDPEQASYTPITYAEKQSKQHHRRRENAQVHTLTTRENSAF